MDAKRIMRPGKTRRERENGVWDRHLKNKDARRGYNRALSVEFKQGCNHRVVPQPKIGE